VEAMKKELNEQTYLDSPEMHDELLDAYFCIADGLMILCHIYKNGHLNFDGQQRIDNFYEEWMGQTQKWHFEILHRIKIISAGERKVPPLFGIDSTNMYSPIRAYVDKLVGAKEESSGIASDVFEMVEFAASVEDQFLRMCMELYGSIIKDNDPIGEKDVQDIMDDSENRLLDTTGILQGLYK
jgi:hypothetical protein